MNQAKSPILSHFDPQMRQQILSDEPLISSLGLGWQDFNFDYYQMGTYETPTYIAENHAVSIVLNETQTERRLDDIYRLEKQDFGSIAVIPACIEHRIAWQPTTKFILLSIQPQALRQIAPESVDPDKIELLPTFATAKPDRVITGIAMGIKQQLETNPGDCDFYVEHLKNALLAHLIKKYCTITPVFKEYTWGLSPYKLKQAVEYINDNLEQQVKLKDVAKLIDISQYYFCRSFRTSMGVSPYQYVIQQRVAKAKELIKGSQLPLADIAYSCGFSSQSQMTQHFRKCVGVTPKVYRDRL
ncbi:MAG: AraC family transcriptional regulator [Cyanobacteria bacterium J06631_2]